MGTIVHIVQWILHGLMRVLCLVLPHRGTSSFAIMNSYMLESLRVMSKKPELYQYLAARQLDRSESDHHTWEITLKASAGITHQAGDILYLFWRQDSQFIQSILNSWNVDNDKKYPIFTYGTVFGPSRKRILNLSEILSEEIEEIEAIPSILGLRHNKMLYPALKKTKRLSPRPFTVSDVVSNQSGDTLRLIAATFDHTVQIAGIGAIKISARAPAFLERLAKGLDTCTEIRAWKLTYPVKLPSGKDAKLPLMLIVTGAGIAGALGELRERRRSETRNHGPVWLIFGIRNWDSEGLYQDELLALVSEGYINRLDVAESRTTLASDMDRRPRQSKNKQNIEEKLPTDILHSVGGLTLYSGRVHTVMKKLGQDVSVWIEHGTHFHISGHTGMAENVRMVLEDILLSQNIVPDKKAALSMRKKWEAERRFLVSTS